MMDNQLHSDELTRIFRLWEYRVSHDQLLLRSPKDHKSTYNIDIILVGVRYINFSTMLRGLQITKTLESDVNNAEKIFGASITKPDQVFVFESNHHRYLIVAAGMKVIRHEMNSWESTLESFGQ